MTAYTVNFHYENDAFGYNNCDNPMNRTIETDSDILKELANLLIHAYKLKHPNTMERYPSRIQLFRGEECILECDLNGNSVN